MATTKKGKQTKRSSSKSRTKKDDVVILKNIIASDVLFEHYGTKSSNKNDQEDEFIGESNTDNVEISDILHEKTRKSRRSIMFYDPHKNQVKYWGVMFDLTNNGPLPRYSTKPCWWCRNKFSYHPIGCPVKYNSQKNGGLDKERLTERMKELNLTEEDGNDFFETEGIFCTFPCVKAYILEQISKTKTPKYKRSLTLLTLLYLKLMGTVAKIPVAGTWKLTTDWGGHMTPHEFRYSTGILEYKETVNVRRPFMFCSSNWIRENRLK